VAIEITDEMRAAVLAEMCQRDGHVVNGNEAIGFDEKNQHGVRRLDPNKLPHMQCQRCNVTWIVLDETGDGYEDAEEKLRSKLKDTKDIDAMREKRKPPKESESKKGSTT
jgi:hypothetical protein